MKVGIIGPSKLREGEIIERVAKIISEKGYEIVLTLDKGSSSEFFAKKYLAYGGKKVYSIVPLDDKEFGIDWVNTEIGEKINCGTWRNQPEKLNEETDVLICIGYAAGVLAEIAYTKWFKPKTVYLIKELINGELPKELKLDLKYISINELENVSF